LRAAVNGRDATNHGRDATNHRGKPIRRRVTCTPLVGQEKDIRGVILLMEEQEKPPASPRE